MNGWEVLYYLLQVFGYVILLRVILSWVAPNSRNPIVEFVDSVTEPILGPVRSILPQMGGLDLSPLVVFLILGLLRGIVGNLAYGA